MCCQTWTVKKVGGGPNNNEESTVQGQHIAGAFETERRHLEDQGSHIRSASLSGAARSQEVDRLREGGRIYDVKRLTRQGSDTWRSSYLGLGVSLERAQGIAQPNWTGN